MPHGQDWRSLMWREAWAKAPRVDPGEQPLWLPLVTHLTDAGRVMALLWDHWVGPGPKAVIEQDLRSPVRAREVAVLAAALHDIGKLTPAFAGQVEEMQQRMESVGYRWPRGAERSDSRILPHGIAGHVIVSDLLHTHGATEAAANAFAVVIGGHHGVPPSARQLHSARDTGSLFGDELWGFARASLMDHVLGELDLRTVPAALASHTLSDASQILLTGMVIVADWIASNSDLFPLVPAFDPVEESPNLRAHRGWKGLNLPRPWLPTGDCLDLDATELLRARFDGANDYAANETQALTLQLAREMAEPGLVIVEALMGAGKTEASLMAAEVLARRFGRSGVFYGLPTRATADAMFHRILPWWTGVPDERGSAGRSIQLRHSGAPLNSQFRALARSVRQGDPTGDNAVPFAGVPAEVGRDEAQVPQWGGRRSADVEAVAHHWTSGRKKAALADTVIATIDHDLLAALTSRHVVLRHLGLARQVVVLDEVHAADTWMFQFLERSLEWLGRFGVPVIALSATLPPDQRTAMVHAYERGRRAITARPATFDSSTGPPRRSQEPQTVMLPDVPDIEDYPVITSVSAGSVRQHAATVPTERTVDLEWFTGDLQDLTDLLGDALRDGGCVVVLCNTVGRAIERYDALRETFGGLVSLAHSRFIAGDRARKDEWLRDTFGPPHRVDPQARQGKIVVATQVVEQSLDVDFDLMVTDLAPIDLILQRIGRLHRHERERPNGLRRARCLIAGFEFGSDPGPESGSVAVYGEHLLWRSAALIEELLGDGRSLVLPRDVPTLVQRCYGNETLGAPGWAEAMDRARQRRDRDQGLAAVNAGVYRLRSPGERANLIGLLETNSGEADTDTIGSPQVREPDGGFEVVLLEEAADGLRLPAHLGDDRPIPTDRAPDWQTTRRLAECMVRVPGRVTNNPRDLDAVMDDLNVNYHPAWQKDPILGGQLILVLGQDGIGTLGRFRATYDPTLGLEITHG